MCRQRVLATIRSAAVGANLFAVVTLNFCFRGIVIQPWYHRLCANSLLSTCSSVYILSSVWRRR